MNVQDQVRGSSIAPQMTPTQHSHPAVKDSFIVFQRRIIALRHTSSSGAAAIALATHRPSHLTQRHDILLGVESPCHQSQMT